MRRTSLLPADIELLKQYGLPDVEKIQATHVSYEKKEKIFCEGEPLERLIIMISGRARVSRSIQNGESILTGFYEGNGMIGELEFFTEGLIQHNIQAVSNVEGIGISLSTNIDYLRENLFFVNQLAKKLASKMERSSLNSAINQLVPVESRLCAYISLMSDEGYFRENMTELAELLGTSYRHLMRILSNLCKKGVLEHGKGKYRICDAQVLEKSACDLTLSGLRPAIY